MDCTQACEILSAAHDHEPVDATLLAAARLHATTCPECAAFLTMLDRVTAVPRPRASDQLIASIDARVAPIAAELREAEVELPPTFEMLQEEHAATHRPVNAWLPRFAAFASAAVIFLAALTIGGIAVVNRLGQSATDAESSRLTQTAPEAPVAGEPGAATAEDATTMAAEAPAPAYVALGTSIWVLTDADAPAPSALTTAGVVSSSLDEAEVGPHLAFYSGADQAVLFVRGADNRYLAFDRVTRSLGRAEYGLTSGALHSAFGVWPTLPGTFAQPQSANGSPTFRRFGFDDRSVDVFIPAGGNVEDGFAVAPDTAPDDPAAGNPNWTWWVALE